MVITKIYENQYNQNVAIRRRVSLTRDFSICKGCTEVAVHEDILTSERCNYLVCGICFFCVRITCAGANYVHLIHRLSLGYFVGDVLRV